MGVSEYLAIYPWWCDCPSSQGCDTLWKRFTFIVFELLRELELLKRGGFTVVDLVNTERASLEEDEDSLEWHAVDGLRDIGWRRWWVDRWLNRAVDGVQEQNAVIVECGNEALCLVSGHGFEVAESFAQIHDAGLWDEVRSRQVGNLSDLDPIARILAENSEDVVINELDVHDLGLHVLSSHVVTLRRLIDFKFIEFN